MCRRGRTDGIGIDRVNFEGKHTNSVPENRPRAAYVYP